MFTSAFVTFLLPNAVCNASLALFPAHAALALSTALVDATKRGHTEIVRMLRQAGAKSFI